MEDITMQDTHANPLSEEASRAATRGQMEGGMSVSELIDNLAVQFSNIGIDETKVSSWFNDLAQPMPSSSVMLPTTTPPSAETGQKAESKFHANLIVVSELAEMPVSDAAGGRLDLLVDEDRQLAASVATLLAAVSASRLSFDSDLQFWAAVGLKMQLKGFERLNPAHDYRQEYKKFRMEAVAIYGDIADDRGRFAQVTFPARVRTQEQEEKKRAEMVRRREEKEVRRWEALNPTVFGERRSARLRRRKEKQADRTGKKFHMHEMGEVLEEIGDELPLPC